MNFYRTRRPGRYRSAPRSPPPGRPRWQVRRHRIPPCGADHRVRRHNPHLAHGPLAGQLDADLFVIFALSFGFLLALACFTTWLLTRRRDLSMTEVPGGKTRRRGRHATVPPSGGYAPFYGPGGWYGGRSDRPGRSSAGRRAGRRRPRPAAASAGPGYRPGRGPGPGRVHVLGRRRTTCPGRRVPRLRRRVRLDGRGLHWAGHGCGRAAAPPRQARRAGSARAAGTPRGRLAGGPAVGGPPVAAPPGRPGGRGCRRRARAAAAPASTGRRTRPRRVARRQEGTATNDDRSRPGAAARARRLSEQQKTAAPAGWQAVANDAAEFEPESDEELLDWMGAEVAGMFVYGEAVVDLYERASTACGSTRSRWRRFTTSAMP